MIPGVIEGATHKYERPPGTTPEECGPLMVRVEEVQYTEGVSKHFTSAWFPTPDELKRLNDGAPVLLTIVGPGLPPASLTVGSNEL